MRSRLGWTLGLLLVTLPALAALPGDGERMAATCGACHGTKGASPGSHIPVIGGQGAAYLRQVMAGYRDGTRPGGVMANLAKGYSDKQLAEISEAVASWKWKNTPLAASPKAKKVAVATEACADCHGKGGEGTEAGPRIRGQAPGYLREALREYKSGKRKAPEMEMLQDMPDGELDALAGSYSRKEGRP